MGEIMIVKHDFDDMRSVEVLYKDSAGEKICKNISFEAYLGALNTLSDAEYKRISRLPDGTVDIAYASEKDFMITLYVEGGPMDITYLKEYCNVSLPHPNMLFVFNVTKGRLASSRCYAVKEQRKCITDSTELFIFPFGNVYRSSGQICWGSNNVASHDYNQISDVSVLIPTFFASVMNNDLYLKGQSCKEDLELMDLVDKYKDKAEFPNDMLNPAKITYGELFEN